MKLLPGIAVFIAAAFQVCAQGYLVPNGVTYAPFAGSFGLNVIQNPTNGDYTGFALEAQGANTFRFDPVVDEGVRTFFVSFNDHVSLQGIQSHNYAELTFPNTYVFNDGVPFYVGLYTGYTPQGGIYSNPLFGWAELVNNNGVIQLLDSALEIGGGGIFAGTQTIMPVPEPSTLGLFALGSLFLACYRWRSLIPSK